MTSMTFEHADKLCAKIVTFMIKCGRNYSVDRIGELQHIVLVSLATGQFIIRMRGDGSIRYFACFWFTDDIDSVLARDAEIPVETSTGQDMYVAEAASVGERGDSMAMIRRLMALRRGHAYWVKPHRDFKVYKDFKPYQREN